jgi:hypothetical protein
MNLLKLPTEICRLIYHQWYFPFVLQELTERVPQKEDYFVTRISNDSDTTDLTIINFSSKNGKTMRMISHTQTVNRLNRKDTLYKAIGRRC